MEAFRIYTTIERDGEIYLANLPLQRGQRVELIVLPETEPLPERPSLTAAALLASDLVGLWQDRDDIDDNVAFARLLRDQGQQRNQP